MTKVYDAARYNEANFDEWFCLKPPALLWLATIFYARAALMPLLVAVGTLSGSHNNGSNLLPGVLSFSSLLAAVPAVLVLWAFVKRSPDASPTVRWLYAHARLLLFASVVINLGAAVLLAPDSLSLNERNGLSLLLHLTDLYFLVYVMFSRHVRDTLADFPLRLPPAPVSAGPVG